MLIDTHAHLFWKSYQEDFDQIINNAVNAGVGTIINVGVDPDTSKQALRQVLNRNGSGQAQGKLVNIPNLSVYSSIGIHPHEAHKYFSNPDVSIHEDISKIEGVYQRSVSNHTNSKVVAVGECGLDFAFEGNSDFVPSSVSIKDLKQLQNKLYFAQIKLAKKLNLPLLIHCRDAWTNIFSHLEGTAGVFHTFTGSLDDLKTALNLGFYISYSCMITYPKNDQLREVIKQTPLDRILTETDSPFLPPQSKRGQRNEPANVAEVVRCIAEIKEISLEEVASQTIQNAKTLFGI